MASICRARFLSDLRGQTVCDQEATSADGRLCAFHSRQCQALYRGYKKRNAELDILSENLPAYFSTKKISIAVHDFADVEDEATLRSIHDYIFKKHNLLDRVIRARKLHHSHFFAIDNDYGHEKYLDRLSNERHVMTKALERLGRQAAALMHQQKQWYDWVKKAQEEEEKYGDTESKKVKLESLLFRRHQKEVARHQRETRLKEDKQREEEFLEQVHAQRLSEMTEEEQDEWDPIQDVYGYEKDRYIELIKFFLMLEDEELSGSDETMPELVEAGNTEISTPADKAGSAQTSTSADKTLSKSAKKRARKANAEVKKMEDPTLQTAEGRGPNIIEMETKKQMGERLRNSVRFERGTGWYLAGKGPLGFNATTPVIPDDEIEQLLNEVAEIKNLLFCRLILSQASLLPAALETDSIKDFLNRGEVTREHLRDICLKLERPGLQDVRDACADFIRERDGVEDEDSNHTDHEDDDEEKEKERKPKRNMLPRLRRGGLPDKFLTKREKAAKKAKKQPPKAYDPEEGGVLDFGKTNDESEYSRNRTRIKVCGRYMYNYPSEKALNRGGWYHFSIIAKDSDLFDAIELCRNWNEFYELNILCLYHYFPAPKWTRFIGDLPRQQLLQLGFIPYFYGDKADKVTHHFQTGSRGMARRSHAVVEMRNFICGHIKRDDPTSRRFIQYLSNESWEIRALVRDRKTGRILIQPPKEELWLLREKSGWGRATRNDFQVVGEIGPEFFEQMDATRKWHFGFVEYYDVYVWDSSPGRSFFILQRKLEEILARSLRVTNLRGMFTATRHILETLTKDPITERIRSIKPDEEVKSMWDGLDETARAFTISPHDGVERGEGWDASYAYTEADELEDALLFPLEATGEMTDNLFRNDPSAMEIFENETIDVDRFAADLDTDEEFDFEGDYDSEDDEEALAALQDDDSDSNWATDEEDLEDDGGCYITQEEQEEQDDTVEMLADRMRQFGIGPDYLLPIARNPASAKNIPNSVKRDPEAMMSVLRSALRHTQEYDTDKIEADFYRHIDRRKSKVFKASWHQADEEPGAIRRWATAMCMTNVMERNIMTSGVTPGPFELCKFMQMEDHFREERRIVDDAFQAYAVCALFFDKDTFYATKLGDVFKDTKLLNQEARAKDVPDRRTHMSNHTMPKEFWKDWDKLLKDNRRRHGETVKDIYPIEWRKAIRPIIIRLFRAGVICSSFGGEAAGVATAKAEPGRPMDLYIDYRQFVPPGSAVSHLKDPTPFDRDFLLRKIKTFRATHASAKFSVLRLWSAPHFYPLMLGYDKRGMCSFLDDRGRCWEFKFIPKDMPFSEWSIHQQLSLRLEPYKKIFGQQVLVAKDLVLVMGTDEKNLRQLTEGVTWAVQTKPWRLEVDFWRSFVNVGEEFLESLDRRWLD